MDSATVSNSISISDIVAILTFVLAVFGSIGAIYQWNKGNKMKRADIVHRLIEIIRDNEEIATIMDIIDWNDAFWYDGKFHLKENDRSQLKDISENNFFHKIDKTLSHFSYICYLLDQRVIKEKDMRCFKYNLTRLFQNKHIRNYLFSLYHWSEEIGTTMSFIYLVEYGLNNGFLPGTFLNPYAKEFKKRIPALFDTTRFNTEYSVTK